MAEESREQALGKGYKYLAMGLRFAGGIVVFLFAGLFLDRKAGTTPLFLLVGTIAGAVLGFLSIYRELTAEERKRREEAGR
jgi:F0F1-type ATP synthase assembly protein I